MKFGNQAKITTEQDRNSEQGGGRTTDVVITPLLQP